MWSIDSFRRKSIAEVVSDTERMKNTIQNIYVKTIFVTLTTGIIFLLFTCMQFWVGEFYKGGLHVSRPPMKWSMTAEILRNTDIECKMMMTIFSKHSI
jgi:hypothetical protein